MQGLTSVISQRDQLLSRILISCPAFQSLPVDLLPMVAPDFSQRSEYGVRVCTYPNYDLAATNAHALNYMMRGRLYHNIVSSTCPDANIADLASCEGAAVGCCGELDCNEAIVTQRMNRISVVGDVAKSPKLMHVGPAHDPRSRLARWSQRSRASIISVSWMSLDWRLLPRLARPTRRLCLRLDYCSLHIGILDNHCNLVRADLISEDARFTKTCIRVVMLLNTSHWLHCYCFFRFAMSCWGH